MERFVANFIVEATADKIDVHFTTQDFISYKVIPDLVKNIELQLRSLNRERKFPFREELITSSDKKYIQFEFLLLTLDELKEIKNDVRFKERMRILSEQKIVKSTEEKNANISNSK